MAWIVLAASLLFVGHPHGRSVPAALHAAAGVGGCQHGPGDDDAARLDHERALAEAPDGRAYYAALRRAVGAIERAEGLEPTLGWLRGLVAWNPRQLAHHRVLGELLIRRDRHVEAAAAFEQGARVASFSVQLEFDEDGAVLWDGARADATFLDAVRELQRLLQGAAEARLMHGGGDAAAHFAARARSLARCLTPDAQPQAPPMLEGGKHYQTRLLEAAVKRGHPTDRRVASAMLVERLARGRINDRRGTEIARLVLDEQLHPGRPWVADLGETFQALWARGALSKGDVDAYLALSLPPPALAVIESQLDPPRYRLTCSLRPRVAGAGSASPFDISARLTHTSPEVDGAPVGLFGVADQSEPISDLAPLVAGEVQTGPLTFVTPEPLVPGRHVLTVTCLFTVRATGESGVPVAEASGAHELRVPFFTR